MSVPLPDRDGALEPTGADTVLERAGRSGALILGPGIGREAGAVELTRNLARAAELPLLLDADGLNAHAGKLGSLAARTKPAVLTPHAGELARLLDSDSDAVGARRLHSARQAAEQSQAVIVLKGDDTLVASPDGRVGVSAGGASALATAGTGDVLSGIIGAYLAKAMDPFDAACAGVRVHARAGQLAAERIGSEGVIARDVIELIPDALANATRSTE
jgi:NAD(P)H-hydrate epimerase